jgi:thiamine kinase-like enzyme
MTEIQSLTDRLKSIPGNIILNKNLASSPISQVFSCTFNNIKSVIRLDRPCASLLAIDRENEFTLLKHIQHLGLAPKILFHNSKKGILIWEYFEGEEFSLTEKTQVSQLRELGGALGRIHESTIFKGSLDIFSASIHLYQNLLENSPHTALIEQTLSLYHEISQDGINHVLSHNDLNKKNLLWNSQFLFLDWEYAGINHPCFDLASLVKSQNLNEDNLCELLIGYCGIKNYFDFKVVKQWILFSDLLDEVWEISVNLISLDNCHQENIKSFF